MVAASLGAAAIVPLAVKVAAVELPADFGGLGYQIRLLDGFSWRRAQILMALGVVAALGVVFGRRAIRGFDLCLLVLGGAAIASAVTSPYQSLGLHGVPHIFEGLWTTLAYLVLAAAAARVAPDLGERHLPWAIAVAGSVAAILGIAERSGWVLINEPWLAEWLLSVRDTGAVSYAGAFGSASLPFGNPNYVGMFAAMTWPYLLTHALSERRLLRFVVLSLASAAVFGLLCGSSSRGGYVAGATAAAVAIIVMVRHGSLRRRSTAIVAALHLAAFFFDLQASGVDTMGRIRSIGSEMTFQPSASAPIGSRRDISVEHGRLRVVTDEWGLLIERLPHSLKFMDLGYRPLQIQSGSNAGSSAIVIVDDRFPRVQMQLRNAGAFEVLTIDGVDIALTDRGFRIGRGTSFYRIVPSERFPLPLDDLAFSYRGFIWSRTLPLLARTKVLGMGGAAFPFEFPNNDPVAMSPIFGLEKIVDKPHSFYLQFAHAHGCLALLVLLTMFGAYVLRAGRSLINAGEAGRLTAQTSLLAGFLGYTIAGLAADSTVGVSAPFWVMFGAGVGLASAARGTRPTGGAA